MARVGSPFGSRVSLPADDSVSFLTFGFKHSFAQLSHLVFFLFFASFRFLVYFFSFWCLSVTVPNPKVLDIRRFCSIFSDQVCKSVVFDPLFFTLLPQVPFFPDNIPPSYPPRAEIRPFRFFPAVAHQP